MTRRKSQVQVACIPPRGRIIRWKRDQVGNDLTAMLRWCETHNEPVWQYDDGSYTCPHTMIVQGDTHDHVLIDGPWEGIDRG